MNISWNINLYNLMELLKMLLIFLVVDPLLGESTPCMYYLHGGCLKQIQASWWEKSIVLFPSLRLDVLEGQEDVIMRALNATINFLKESQQTQKERACGFRSQMIAGHRFDFRHPSHCFLMRGTCSDLEKNGATWQRHLEDKHGRDDDFLSCYPFIICLLIFMWVKACYKPPMIGNG